MRARQTACRCLTLTSSAFVGGRSRGIRLAGIQDALLKVCTFHALRIGIGAMAARRVRSHDPSVS